MTCLPGLKGTVGVAPGTFTLQLGGCGVDVDGPVSVGVPSRTWYDSVQVPATAGPTVKVAVDPYGTDSALKGPPMLGSVRLDILGIIAAIAVGIGFTIHHLAKR